MRYDLHPDYYNDVNRTPEQRLVLAVIVRALRDYLQLGFSSLMSKEKKIYLKRDAERWLYGTDDYPFSFENCCSYVGLDPDYLLEGLDDIDIESLGKKLHNGKVY